jgi:hypothetical protein
MSGGAIKGRLNLAAPAAGGSGEGPWKFAWADACSPHLDIDGVTDDVWAVWAQPWLWDPCNYKWLAAQIILTSGSPAQIVGITADGGIVGGRINSPVLVQFTADGTIGVELSNPAWIGQPGQLLAHKLPAGSSVVQTDCSGGGPGGGT